MQAIKYTTTVDNEGAVALPHLQLQPGTAIEIIVLVRDREDEITDEGAALLKAAESSLAFWDNNVDDEVWNDA